LNRGWGMTNSTKKLKQSRIIMSTSGYKCEFLEEVPELFRCKKCSQVARKATLTTCCTETYCQSCIADIQKVHKTCPICGEKSFTIIKAVKYEKGIEKLRVNCSMKERGCVWTGTLGELDSHLDPDQDKCQYVDTKCPLYCQQVVGTSPCSAQTGVE